MKLELNEFNQQITTLVAFVEGRLEVGAFELALQSSAMQQLLASFDDERCSVSGNFYQGLTKLHVRANLAGLVNSEGLVLEFLQKAEIACKPVMPYRSLYQLILECLPLYVDPPLDFLLEHVIPIDKSLSKSAMKQQIKNKIAELFSFSNHAPEWVHAAEWPIEADQPAFFIGQIGVCAPETTQDIGVAYLFFHKNRGDYETVTQYY